MGKAPAFQFYANDFMDATSTWEANAVGLYVRCLCKQWTHGSIPADLRILARAIHTDREELEMCWPVLGPKFVDQGDGTLKNSKLEEVRARQIAVSEKRSQAGKLGAIAKANANELPQAKYKQRKVKEKEKEILKLEDVVEPELCPTFDDFWQAYERKGNRKTATAEWAKTTQQEREAIMAHIPGYKAAKPDKQYRKDAERYLKHRVWEDEIITSTPTTNGKHRSESQLLAETLALAAERHGQHSSNPQPPQYLDGGR